MPTPVTEALKTPPAEAEAAPIKEEDDSSSGEEEEEKKEEESATPSESPANEEGVSSSYLLTVMILV